VRLESNEDAVIALERLARRSPITLAQFILSLAFDSGPVGEQVRTFIVGDDMAEASAAIRARIERLSGIASGKSRNRAGADLAQRLAFIVDAIETQVLPIDPRVAFYLLLEVMRRDGEAVEASGDCEHEVAMALERAGVLILRTTELLPGAYVQNALGPLLATDDYGTRRSLLAVAKARSEQS
jgi:hypothetical protein